MSSSHRRSRGVHSPPDQANQEDTPSRPFKRVKIAHGLDGDGSRTKHGGSAVTSNQGISRSRKDDHRPLSGEARSKPASHKSQSLSGRRSTSSRPGTEASPAPIVYLDVAAQQAAREKLKKWLEKRGATTVIFPITSLRNPERQGQTKGRARVFHDDLKIDGRRYGNAAFTVSFESQWNMLKQYRKCLIQDETYSVGDCVLVYSSDDTANERTLASAWKAQIREVRAFDEDHVYLRVTWLLRPHLDLPAADRDFLDPEELVPSDHMNIIDAKSVDGRITLKTWSERPNDPDDDTDPFPVYYWQQCYNSLTRKYTPESHIVCQCAQPANKAHAMLQCQYCDRWMHERCLELAAVKRENHHHPGGAQPLTRRDSSMDDGRNHDGIVGCDMRAEATVQTTCASSSAQPRVVAARIDKTDEEKPLMILTREIYGGTEEVEREAHCVLCSRVLEPEREESSDESDEEGVNDGA